MNRFRVGPRQYDGIGDVILRLFSFLRAPYFRCLSGRFESLPDIPTSHFSVPAVYCEPNPQARICMLRPRHGRLPCRIDWRQSSNLDAAFAASASAAGRDSLPLAPEMFRYEVDPTCGGVLGGSIAGAEDGGLRCPGASALGTCGELYSPAALSFISPAVEVPWPVGVLLPAGVLRTYSSCLLYTSPSPRD